MRSFHLQKHTIRPVLREVILAAERGGMLCLEAPGELGGCPGWRGREGGAERLLGGAFGRMTPQ